MRREQIIAAVRRIITTAGLEALTIARIAAEANVSRGVVTYHFDDKEEIIHATLRAAMRDANRATDAFAVEGSARDLASLAERVAALAGSNSDWWHLYVALLNVAQRSGFYRSELAWVHQQYTQALARLVGNEARATLVLAVLQGLAIQRLVSEDLALGESAQELALLLESWEQERRGIQG